MKKLAKRKKRLQRDRYSVAMRSLCRYMETQGWKMMVVGGLRVQGLGAGDFGRYELVIKFSGGKILASPDSE